MRWTRWWLLALVVTACGGDSGDGSDGDSLARLTVETVGQGVVALGLPGAPASCPPTCAVDVVEGAQVPLEAQPAEGWVFEGWSGACSGTSASTSVAVDGATTCTATFVAVLEVSLGGWGNGSVVAEGGAIDCGTDCEERYTEATSVTLIAAPEPGSTFLEWSGDCTGEEPQVQVTVDRSKSCRAHFGQAARLGVKVYDSGGIEQFIAVALTNEGDLYLGGSRNEPNSDAWLVHQKLDGTIGFSRSIDLGSGSNETVYEVRPTSDGGVVWTGFARRGEEWRGVVGKLDRSGTEVWRTVLSAGTGGRLTLTGGQLSPDGTVVVAGRLGAPGMGDIYAAKLDPDGQLLWQKTYPAGGAADVARMQATGDGGAIIAGSLVVGGDEDVAVVRIDANGEILWQRTYGRAITAEYASAVAATRDGGFLVAATIEGNSGADVDALLLRLSATGDIQWKRSLVGDGDEEAISVVELADGGVVTTGYTTSATYDSGQDAWVARFDASGTLLWQRTYDASSTNGDESAEAVARIGDGILLAGYANGVGTTTLDGWLLELAPDGTVMGCSVPGIASEVQTTTIGANDPSIDTAVMSATATDATLSEVVLDATVTAPTATVTAICE